VVVGLCGGSRVRAPRRGFVVKEFLSGWYVRGDFSYRLVGTPALGIERQLHSFSSYDDALGYGAGVGYKANWFRADVTVDGSRSSFVGNTPFAAPTSPPKVTTVTALANAYLDLGSCRTSRLRWGAAWASASSRRRASGPPPAS